MITALWGVLVVVSVLAAVAALNLVNLFTIGALEYPFSAPCGSSRSPSNSSSTGSTRAA